MGLSRQSLKISRRGVIYGAGLLAWLAEDGAVRFRTAPFSSNLVVVGPGRVVVGPHLET